MKISGWIIIILSVLLTFAVAAMIITIQGTIISKTDLQIRCEKAERNFIEQKAAVNRRDKNLQAISDAATFKNYKRIIQELDKWRETRRIESEEKSKNQ